MFVPAGVRIVTNYIELENEQLVQRAALVLRQAILSIKPKKLKEGFTVDDLKLGECEIPDILIAFYKVLLAGTKYDCRTGYKSMVSKFNFFTRNILNLCILNRIYRYLSCFFIFESNHFRPTLYTQ